MSMEEYLKAENAALKAEVEQLRDERSLLIHQACDDIEERNKLKAEVEKLRERLHDQTLQTQNTAQQKHDAVLETIDRYGGVPDGIDPQGHPIEQILGTVMAKREAEIA